MAAGARRGLKAEVRERDGDRGGGVVGERWRQRIPNRDARPELWVSAGKPSILIVFARGKRAFTPGGAIWQVG